MEKPDVSILEIFGISQIDTAVKDASKALFGKGKVPPSQFDLSSIKIFKPDISFPTWLGIKRKDRKAPIYNFYNRSRPPIDDAFSVKVTYAEDFTGGKWTYNSHMGTDFAIPVGTHVVTCAPGKVIRISSQLDHGGLKIFIDHGKGLITTYAHLSRALVEEGEKVGRGAPIALSGAAGLELILLFPWISPHLHLNVILNGDPVDPFAIPGETPLWLHGNDPVPHHGVSDDDFMPTEWNEALLDNAISFCSDTEEREYLKNITNLVKKAAEVINYRMFYNTLFSDFPPIYEKEYERIPILDLPFRKEDYTGAAFPGK
ncbi:MAG TPA: M23 family metallopeptidase [bacterium]|nr:M23 family metallopeptidase [bacterium]